jgi:hypothetical protein
VLCEEDAISRERGCMWKNGEVKSCASPFSSATTGGREALRTSLATGIAFIPPKLSKHVQLY